MKNQKINFFESPNPRHINFHNFTEYECYLSDDNEVPEDRLFSTPIKMNKGINNGVVSLLGHFHSCPQIRCQRKTSEDIFGQLSQHQENIEQQPLSFQGIKEKVSFSDNEEDEELLIPITPLKNQHKGQPQQLAETVKKQTNFYHTPATMLTPTSQNRSAERGLKKLAAQAYRFVVHQKRTSYKEVAKKLIEQLGDQSELDVTKRGEMNIKRRVYDALNVLIALGLLRRNGNKIMSKRQQMQFVTEDLTYARERQRRRESAMLEELAKLRQTLHRKEQLMNQKQKLQLEIKQKMESIKEITDKNKNWRQRTLSQDNKLQFPLMVVCYNKSSEQTNIKRQQINSKNRTQMVDEKQQQTLKIWQNNTNNLVFSFNKHKNVEFLGQFDILGLCRTEEKKEKAVKIEKIKRRR